MGPKFLKRGWLQLKHNCQSATKWTYEGITYASWNNNEDPNAPRTECHNIPMTKHQSTTYNDM